MRAWAVVPAPGQDDGYTPPEAFAVCLAGICPERIGHSERMRTSVVKDYDPATRTVTCSSGNQYILDGDPEPEYAKWCLENGYDWQACLTRPR
jgi:hypothetical protein